MCVYACACVRSEEHTSELQSHSNLVCRLLLEKNSTHNHTHLHTPPATHPPSSTRTPPGRHARARSSAHMRTHTHTRSRTPPHLHLCLNTRAPHAISPLPLPGAFPI